MHLVTLLLAAGSNEWITVFLYTLMNYTTNIAEPFIVLCNKIYTNAHMMTIRSVNWVMAETVLPHPLKNRDI